MILQRYIEPSYLSIIFLIFNSGKVFCCDLFCKKINFIVFRLLSIKIHIKLQVKVIWLLFQVWIIILKEIIGCKGQGFLNIIQAFISEVSLGCGHWNRSIIFFLNFDLNLIVWVKLVFKNSMAKIIFKIIKKGVSIVIFF